MVYAKFLAIISFNNAWLGYFRAMVHQMSDFYDFPQGVYNALLLPNVIEFCAYKCSNEKLLKIISLFGKENKPYNKDPKYFIIIKIKELSKTIRIPKGFKELVLEKYLITFVENALKDACGFISPRVATKDEIIEIYKKLM